MNRFPVLVAATLLALTVRAGTPASQEAALGAVGVTQKIGDRVPLGLRFRNSRDEVVTLDEFVAGRPALLQLAWYDCPSLCDLSLRHLGREVAATRYAPGEDFTVITVSIDPREHAASASRAEKLLDSSYGGGARDGQWHVLTGTETSIRALADSLGFRYRYDAESRQFAHPAGLAVLTGDGRISSYLLGLSFVGRDLQLALTRAGRGSLGGITDQIVLRCFRFDPEKGVYTMDVLRLLNAACIATAIGLCMLVGALLWRRRGDPPGRVERRG